MRTLSCLFQPPNRRPHPGPKPAPQPHTRGQVLVIFAVALIAMLLFIGLAVDAGGLYVTYGHLKRAVDAAAVSAANEFKRNATLDQMRGAATEVLNMHNIDIEAVDMQLYICDADGDGQRDASLQTTVPGFYARCPDTLHSQAARKLVWVEADLRAPLYFLQLIGFDAVTLNTNSTAEAAAVDLVIVLDTSESMASDTVEYIKVAYPNVVDDYDPDQAATNDDQPTGCNVDNTCQPLLNAKIAAKALVDNLYQGYDRVSIVTFDSQGYAHPINNQMGVTVDLSDDLDEVRDAIDAIKLHDDPPYSRMWPYWRSALGNNQPLFNPVNPEDRDGDGADSDPLLPTCWQDPLHPLCCQLDDDRFDESRTYKTWGGMPCDDDYKYDAYDWDKDGIYTDADHNYAVGWLNARDPDGSGPLKASLSPLSTCTGCGMRVASNVLRNSGRPGSVWVIVLLSDGLANLSDTPLTYSAIPTAYKNGFCSGKLGEGFWPGVCMDFELSPRICIDQLEETCAPGTVWTGQLPNPNYSVMDYARDMTDEAALTKSNNSKEPAGNDIAIYTIGLGAAGSVIPGKGAVGEELLRYMAAVGDDGDRETDPCSSTPNKKSCGQYYYAPTGDQLLPIFEDIATRIYTRITN